MADQNQDGSPMTPAQARAAKAREGAAKARAERAAKENPSATERVPAPDTITPEESEETKALKAKLEQAEIDAKALEETLEKTQNLLKQATTLPPPVVAPPVAHLPRNMRVERTGSTSAPYSIRWPQIRGGTCEFCGSLDGNVPAQYQYKLCPHFRGMTARCTYCPENKDPDEVVYHANMNVAEHPDKPGVLIMWCNSTVCSDAHFKRFNQAKSF